MNQFIAYLCALGMTTYVLNPFLAFQMPETVPGTVEAGGRGEAVEAAVLLPDEETKPQGQAAGEEGQAASAPDLGITAASAILMEATTGTVIYEKNPDEKLRPASITKIMTLILIFDALESGKIQMTDSVSTSAYAKSMGGSQVFLEEGEVQTVETLIKCIVVASGNDASVAMAEYIAGSESEFVRQMNERAAGLGMNNTNFEDCCGLTESATHLTSARDVAIMSRELITKYPKIHDYSTIWMENITHVTNKGSSVFGLANTNKLLKMSNSFTTTGLKTGSTSLAKYCVSATATKDGVDLIAVIMAAPDYKARFSEAASLLNYGFANCKLYRDEDPGALQPITVRNGVKEEANVRYGSVFSYLSTTGEDFQTVEKEWVYNENVEAPLEDGDKVGELIYRLGGKEIGKISILAAENVKKATYLDYLNRLWKRFTI